MLRSQKSLILLALVTSLIGNLHGQNGRGNDQIRSSVPAANQRVGNPPNVVAPGFFLSRVAQGTDPLENPSGVITQFGFLSDATKTEADENTYLVLEHNPGGPTPNYDYGRRFLFQGHENSGNKAYVTRINLDVTDAAHRITLLTPVGSDALTHFNSIDGSTWDPFTHTLLFTQEAGANGGVIEITLDWPVTVRTLDGILGKGGYEGIHPDDRGNLFIVEDVGGTTVASTAKQPNSFIYRFVPQDASDLSQGGKLQALQVSIDGVPLVFHPGQAASDVVSVEQLKLHTPGTSYPAKWITVHDTAVDGTSPFSANALAKTRGATPLKRPENGQFLPGSDFHTFFFDTTGDTNATAGGDPALAARGAWGAIWRLDLDGTRDQGTLAIFVLGTAEQNSFDNLAFVDTKTLLAAEDRGDTLHGQLNTLDSIWAYDVRGTTPNARRFLALGQDVLATSEDNEPTGLHVSEGDTRAQGMQGKPQNPTSARWFFTQQHGMNQVWEIMR